MAEPPAPGASKGPVPDASGGKIPPLTVVLVDDDPAVRGVVERVLVRMGHEVHAFSSPEETDVVHRFDMAMVDYNLGQGGGGEGLVLLDKLRSRCPKACCILTSGARPQLVSPELGGPIFLRKPFSRAELIDLINQALELRGA